MNWIKITNNTNLPEVEVLAIGFQNEYLVGYLTVGQHGQIKCESDETELIYVTHYCELIKPEDGK